LEKRIRDLGLSRVEDPRVASKVDIALGTILSALVVSMTTQARSQRAVERRTEQISAKHKVLFGIGRRIADNTFGKVLPRLRVMCLVASLHRLIKAEHRRGNLQPERVPFGVIAIDGKNAGTLHWPDLCRVLALDPQRASATEVKAELSKRYPEAQLCVPETGSPYALIRMHTVTLISSEAAPCIHIRPIDGSTNEIGSMPALLAELKAAYGKTRLFALVTTDAGNTSLKSATLTLDLGCDYFAQIKGEHGALYQEAYRALRSQKNDDANATYADTQNGKTVTYHAWVCDLGETGWLDWTHARQLVRVQRVTEHPVTGETTVGNRYYVTSRSVDRLDARQALTLSRLHWRCEEETHWTSDAELLEDKRRLSWSRNPRGVLVVAALRMMALAILATARRLSRMDYSKEPPSWGQVAEHFLLVLCGTTLQTAAFDRV
jgi:hypothetical protein